MSTISFLSRPAKMGEQSNTDEIAPSPPALDIEALAALWKQALVAFLEPPTFDGLCANVTLSV